MIHIAFKVELESWAPPLQHRHIASLRSLQCRRHSVGQRSVHLFCNFFEIFYVITQMADVAKMWTMVVNIGLTRSNQGSMESQRAALSFGITWVVITFQYKSINKGQPMMLCIRVLCSSVHAWMVVRDNVIVNGMLWSSTVYCHSIWLFIRRRFRRSLPLSTMCFRPYTGRAISCFLSAHVVCMVHGKSWALKNI